MKGYDGGKKINGRKRHILVDTFGHLLRVVVHSAGIHDRSGLALLVGPAEQARSPRLEKIFLDKGYRGTGVKYLESLGLKGEVVTHKEDRPSYYLTSQETVPLSKGFRVLPRRWVVERCFAWYGLCRRLSKEYDYLTQTTEAWIYLRAAMLIVNKRIH